MDMGDALMHERFRDADGAVQCFLPLPTTSSVMKLVVRDGAVVNVGFVSEPSSSPTSISFIKATSTKEYTRDDMILTEAYHMLRQYLFNGAPDPARSLVPLDLSSYTPFQRYVYQEVRKVPLGTTISYGSLAR